MFSHFEKCPSTASTQTSYLPLLFTKVPNAKLLDMDPDTAFFVAIKNDHLDKVEALIRRQCVDVDEKFAPDNKSAIFRAVESGHTRIVRCLIKHGCSVNVSDRRGDTPLHQAVRDRRIDLIEILLKERANICVLNHDRLNALHLAVYLRCLDIAKILINSCSTDDVGAIVFRPEEGTMSPFAFACSKGYDEIVVYFLKFVDDSVSKRIVQWSTGMTNPFNYVLRLKEETVEAMVDRLAIPDFMVSSREDYMKWSPLHQLALCSRTVEFKSAWITTLLMKKAHAPPDVQDISGRTPLHLAIQSVNGPVINALLRAGCRTDIPDQFGNTPLCYAAMNCEHNYHALQIVEWLLAYGLDMNRERWLRTLGERDPSVRTSPVLGALLELQEKKSLMNLQRFCRTAIRKHWKADADEILENVKCLPVGLKTFLLVEDEPEVLALQDKWNWIDGGGWI